MSLLRLRALLNITSARLDEKQDDDFVVFHFRLLVTNFLQLDASQEVLEICIKCFTNLCSSQHRTKLLMDSLASDTQRQCFISKLNELLSSDWRTLTIGFLCNLSRDEVWLNRLVEGRNCDQLLDILFPINDSIRGTVGLILNLTTHPDFRRSLCSNDVRIKQLITEFNSEADEDVAALYAGVIKNCCFEDNFHLTFLQDSVGLLEALLLRLCGPEDTIDLEDRQVLPMRVQEVIGTAKAVRSKSFRLKTTICQALLQLCATSDGRTHLRSRGVYYVLRELNKYEDNMAAKFAAESSQISYKELIFYLEQVVDQLICEERERDKATVETSLRNIQIDEETRKKLDRIKLDSLGLLETSIDT